MVDEPGEKENGHALKKKKSVKFASKADEEDEAWQSVEIKKLEYRVTEYKMHNSHVSFRGDHDVDELIDVIEANRKYVKCIYAYNKIDTISIEEVDKLMEDPYNAAISVHMNLGCDILLEKIWDTLGLVRVYTRKKG